MADISIKRGEFATTICVTGQPDIVVAYADLTDEIRGTAMRHGIGHKLGDAGAKSRNPDTGQSATPGEKYASIRAVADNLLAGLWNSPTRESLVGVATAERLTVLCRMFDIRPINAQSWADGRTKEQLAQAFSSARFLLELAKYRAESATTPDSVFEGLDDGQVNEDVVMADEVGFVGPMPTEPKGAKNGKRK